MVVLHILKSEQGILIDSSRPNKFDRSIKGIAKVSIKREEIKFIILTHGHWDHIGSAMDSKQMTKAKILIHRKDMHFLADEKPTQPPGLNSWGRTVSALLTFISPMIHVPKIEVDIIAGDKEPSLADREY